MVSNKENFPTNSEKPRLELRPEQERYLAGEFFNLAQEVYRMIDDREFATSVVDHNKRKLAAAEIEAHIFRNATQILGISELGVHRAVNRSSLTEHQDDEPQ